MTSGKLGVQGNQTDEMWLMTMNRQEAAKILGEVMRKCNGSTLTNRVCLCHAEPLVPGSNRYELQIGIEADAYLKEHIRIVLKKHNLAIKEAEKTITIYRPTTIN